MSSSSSQNLDYDPASLSVYGRPDDQLTRPAKRWGGEGIPDLPWDPSFVEHVTRFHGGLPRRNWFRSRTGRLHRLYRFVVFASPETLKPPPEPGRGYGDPRLWWDFGCLETYANIADGCGYWLVPFAVLYHGPNEPYGGDLMHADLLCFDYKARPGARPSVVVWHNDLGIAESARHEGDGIETRLLDLDHATFTEPVAENFDEFVGLLRSTPEELGETRPEGGLRALRAQDLRTVAQVVAEFPAAAEDLRAVQGRWQVVARHDEGRPARNSGVTRYVVDGNRFEEAEADLDDISHDGVSDFYRTFTLDPTATPKRIVFRNVWRTDNGVIYESDYVERGFYEIEGDRLTVAVGNDGDDPVELGSRAFSHEVLRRLT